MNKLLALILSAVMLLSVMTALADTPVTPLTDLDFDHPVIDPKAPLNSQYFGMYAIELKLESGATRALYQYVPTTWIYRQPSVAIGVPAGEDPIAFFEKTGWKDASENGRFAVILMVAGEGGWQADEAEYVNAAFDYMNDRTYLQTQDSAFYMVGYGDAANGVMAHAVTNAELLAGFAALGVDNFDVSILEQGRTEPSAAEGVMKREVAVPMWIGCEEKTPAVEELIAYWKNANDCGDDAVSNAYADEIYAFPVHLATTNEITYANVSKVYVTVGLEDVYSVEFTNNLWSNFLRRVRRQDSGDINSLRWFASNDELGMDHVQLDVDGVTREFWVYVPSEVKEGRFENVPVVFVFHGGGGSGEEFPNRSGWTKVAEEKNFIAVYPTGSRGNTKFKASSTWKTSDLSFFKAAREYVLNNYSVDQTRVYATGHSMGAGMTCYIVALEPELIAAGCANDGLFPISGIEGVKEDAIIPFMLNVGDKDYGFITKDGQPDHATVAKNLSDMRARFGITESNADSLHGYVNGDYYGWDFFNADGALVLREQWNIDKIHCMIPDDPYVIYDFLCQYSRAEDGTSYWRGVEITR